MAEKVFKVKTSTQELEAKGEKFEGYWLDLGNGQWVPVVQVNGTIWQLLTVWPDPHQVTEVKQKKDFFTGDFMVDVQMLKELVKSKSSDPIDLIPVCRSSDHQKKVCDTVFTDLLKQDYGILIEDLDEKYKKFSPLILYFVGPHLNQTMPTDFGELYKLWNKIKNKDGLTLPYATFFILNGIDPEIEIIMSSYIYGDEDYPDYGEIKSFFYIINWYQEVVGPVTKKAFSDMIQYYFRHIEIFKDHEAAALKYYKELLKWGIEQTPPLYPKGYISYTYSVMNYNDAEDLNYLNKLISADKPLIPGIDEIIRRLIRSENWPALDFIANLDKSVVQKFLRTEINRENKELKVAYDKDRIRTNILKLEEKLANPNTMLIPTLEELNSFNFGTDLGLKYKQYLESRGY